MLAKIRDNIYLGDSKVKKSEIEKAGITAVVVVADEHFSVPLPDGVVRFDVGLAKDKINRPHTKDIACHIPKYMVQNGEIVAILSVTGLIRAAYVTARAICELEGAGIYEVLLSMQDSVEGLEIGRAYL